MKKQAVFEWLCNALAERERDLQSAWEAMMESNQQEGKSSSGDKHETGRAMVHLELEQLGKQRQEIQKQRAEVLRLVPLEGREYEQVEGGALVTTSVGLYYMITGWGKVIFQGKEVLIIGIPSPVGKALLGKRIGAEFEWGNIRGIITRIE
jgi:hypothetical protein